MTTKKCTKKWLTSGEACAVLGISRARLHQLVKGYRKSNGADVPPCGIRTKTGRVQRAEVFGGRRAETLYHGGDVRARARKLGTERRPNAL